MNEIVNACDFALDAATDAMNAARKLRGRDLSAGERNRAIATLDAAASHLSAAARELASINN